MKGTAITKYFLSNYWAITPSYFDVMQMAFDEWKSIEGAVNYKANSDGNPSRITDSGVAVLTYSGSFHKKLSGLNAMSGGISGETIINELRVAVDDNSVRAIVLSLDTPGGTVDGVSDVVLAIKEAKTSKPVITYANGLLASAGVWLGVTSNAVVCNEMAQVGSIGVIMVHQEESKAKVKSDITTTVLTAGKYKGDGNRFEPLSDQARNSLQDSLDYYYSMFIDHVAEARDMTIADCLTRAGEGRIFIGAQAVEAGLVDHIGNLETAINLALTLGGYNVKQELQKALATMGSKELMASLEGHSALPKSVREAIDASSEETEEITISKVDYNALNVSLTEANSKVHILTESNIELNAKNDDLRIELTKLTEDTEASTARNTITSQFDTVGYEASDAFIDSLLAMENPSIVIEETLALHAAKTLLAKGLTEPKGLDESPDASAVPTTIDAAVNRVMASENLDIDAAIDRAAELYPKIFKR